MKLNSELLIRVAVLTAAAIVIITMDYSDKGRVLIVYGALVVVVCAAIGSWAFGRRRK
jgi:hypothetical protein